MKTLMFASLLFISFSSYSAEKWKVTTLNWEPFSGSTLPNGGAGIEVLRECLKTEGIELEVEFLPWTRAIETAKKPMYAGVYPSWPEDVGEGFAKSDLLFKSPVGFVEPTAKPLIWEKLEDLKGKKIGTVQDYGNTVEFNTLIKNGTILTEVVSDDLTNVKKVAAGRVDGAFIDLNNLDYYLKHDAKDLTSKVQANKKTLGSKDLVLGINQSFNNKNAANIIKSCAKKINADEIIKKWMTTNLK